MSIEQYVHVLVLVYVVTVCVSECVSRYYTTVSIYIYKNENNE